MTDEKKFAHLFIENSQFGIQCGSSLFGLVVSKARFQPSVSHHACVYYHRLIQPLEEKPQHGI